MELWQVRKEYGLLAMSLRRRKDPPDEHLELIEEQVLTTIILCDRCETEQGVLRLAKRCALARLRRVRRYVEKSGIHRTIPRPLTRRDDQSAADELARALEKKGRDPGFLRQLLAELTHLDRRLADTAARLIFLTAQAATGLVHLRAASRPPAQGHSVVSRARDQLGFFPVPDVLSL